MNLPFSFSDSESLPFLLSAIQQQKIRRYLELSEVSIFLLNGLVLASNLSALTLDVTPVSYHSPVFKFELNYPQYIIKTPSENKYIFKNPTM